MTLNGFDIAVYQRGINISALPGDFIIIKATEGTDYVSPAYAEQVKAAQAAGRLIGVYHYLTGVNPETQARFFAGKVGSLLGTAVLCLDVEAKGLTANQTHSFATQLHNETGVWPLIYCSTANLESMTDAATRAKCGIWQADWGDGEERTAFPDPHRRPSGAPAGSTIAAWQFTSKFKSAGWPRHLDADTFFGDADTWKAYARGDGNAVPAKTDTQRKTVAELAKEVIAGKWGNGAARRKALEAAGYDYTAVQNEVNKQLKPAATRKTVAELAKEVIAGKWGNGAARRKALEAAGYDYTAVQNEVNRRLKAR